MTDKNCYRSTWTCNIPRTQCVSDKNSILKPSLLPPAQSPQQIPSQSPVKALVLPPVKTSVPSVSTSNNFPTKQVHFAPEVAFDCSDEVLPYSESYSEF